MEIIRNRRSIHVERYSLDFAWATETGAGFSFPCDKQGNILYEEMPASIARENLESCKNGTFDVIVKGVIDCSYNYPEQAQGRCSCGTIVDLLYSDNECERCGRLYNLFGQELAPRSQWGEY